MWTNVDNPLSHHQHLLKTRSPPVDNDCGQMCTILWSDEKNRAMSTTFEWHKFASF